MNVNFFKKLCATPSPSGYENLASSLFVKECTKILYDTRIDEDYWSITTDGIGNAIVKVGNGSKSVMLSGHIDEIGLQVQYIDDDGFIHFVKDGGTDDKVLPGSTVGILSNGKLLKGVIGKSPIHIEWNDESKDKVTKVKDLKIDCGFENKKDAAKEISVGDPIVILDIPFERGNRIFSRGIDDKSGVWVVVETLRKITSLKNLKKHLDDYSLYFVACTQEEVGCDGAVVAAHSIKPNLSIDYDVTFATDDGNVKKEEWGDIKLGKGGCIAYGPDKNQRLCNFVKKVCEDNKIPYQPFVVENGGTNTESIKLQSMNPLTETLLLSIPQRNMHTQVEVCDVRDIQSLVDMTCETILGIFKKEYALLE